MTLVDRSTTRLVRFIWVGLTAFTLAFAFQAGTATDVFAQPKAGDPVKQATDLFKQGQALFQARQFPQALDLFQRSYATVASPNSGLYIARCHNEMGRFKESYLQYRKVIGEAEGRVATEPKYKPTLDTARTEIEQVAGKISILTVQVSNPAANSTLRVGATVIPREQWGQPIPLDAGPVDVVLDTVGAPPSAQKLNLARGEKKTIVIAPAGPVGPVGPGPGPGPRRRTNDRFSMLPLAITFGGIGVVGMGMFAVAGGLSLGTYSEVEDNCPNGPTCTDDLIDRGEREQLIANVGLVVGAVGLAAGATFLIVEVATGGVGNEAKAPVNLAIGPGYVGVDGAF